MNDKEAIERLNRFKTIKVMYGNTFAMHLEQLKQLQQDLEIILNLIENQKAEIEKKDKQIDLMANNLIGVVFSNNDNKEILFDNKEDVKEYFEKKVEEDK